MSILGVSPLIDSLQIPGGIGLIRAGQSTQNSRGAFVAAASVESNLQPVAAHNASGRDLLQMKEADRNAEAIKVYTKVRLFVSDDGQASDKLRYQGRIWRVTTVKDYLIQGNCYISLATLQDVQQP